VGALADGGCYYLKYSRGRIEYRCVWTQKDLRWLINSIIPRLRIVMEYYSIHSKIQLIKGRTRYEARVSSKKLYAILTDYMGNLPVIVSKDQDIARAWLAGLYDAEGDKASGRIRIWSKNREQLMFAKTLLEKQGIETHSPYLDDKERNVYVIEVSSPSKTLFLDKIIPEHPKLVKKNF